MWKLAALAALSWPVAAEAQIPDVQATPHQLRTMTVHELRDLIFGPTAPAFTDAWVEGPTRQRDDITVELATRPTSTGYAGLCQAELGNVYFLIDPRNRGEDVAVELSMTPRVRRVFLIFEGSSLTPTTDTGCDHMPSPLGPHAATATGIRVSPNVAYAGKDDAVVAQFAFSAMIAARKAAGSLTVATERCYHGSGGIPYACDAPADYIRSIYLRDIETLAVSPCAAAGSLCVDATVKRPFGRGWDHVVIQTRYSRVEEHLPGSTMEIASLAIRAGDDPIP